MRKVGTSARGIRCPIIRSGDDLAQVVVNSVLEAAKAEGFTLRDRDIIGITESLLARSQGNYASIDAIASEIKAKFPGGELGVIFPILSRNRFATLLKGIARGAKKIYLMLSYPRDEVGNALLSEALIEKAGVNPYTDILTVPEYRKLYGYPKHEFTGIDYVELYTDIVEQESCKIELIFANHAQMILNYTKHVLTCDVHTRQDSKHKLKVAGAETIYGLDDLLTTPQLGEKGFNPQYGLLGSNKATDDSIKLFPRDGQPVVEKIQQMLLTKTGKHIEVLIYGDGAFKDPQGHIWELADPVVSPFFTPGLSGTPSEVKLKYLADNDFKNLTGAELTKAIAASIKAKPKDLVGTKATLGTTPRQITDLVGSLCDLVSGSGDKGTPVVLIQGYFDNYTDN